MTTLLAVVVLFCFAYLLLVNLVAVVFLVVGAVENAVREKRLSPAESGRFMRRYEEALEGYTYLTVND